MKHLTYTITRQPNNQSFIKRVLGKTNQAEFDSIYAFLGVEASTVDRSEGHPFCVYRDRNETLVEFRDEAFKLTALPKLQRNGYQVKATGPVVAEEYVSFGHGFSRVKRAEGEAQ